MTPALASKSPDRRISRYIPVMLPNRTPHSGRVCRDRYTGQLVILEAGSNRIFPARYQRRSWQSA